VVENGNFLEGYDQAKGVISPYASGWVSQNPPVNLVLGHEINKHWPLHNPVAYLTNGNDIYQQINFDNDFYQVSDSQCLSSQ
jgi:hypothetical protein